MSTGFDLPVPDGGYAWWYLDALSDDGRHGLTLIAFVGSVFSPYYAWARRQGAAAAGNHCALNVALYAAPGSGAPTGWAMTERGAGALRRTASRLQIGPSGLDWSGDELVATLDEVTVPWPSRVRGTLRLQAPFRLDTPHALDAGGQHHWCPIAPAARIEVALDAPRLRWQGHAYLDHNRGRRPLECDFEDWHWSRAGLPDGGGAVLYDVRRRDGTDLSLALRFGRTGGVTPFEPPPPAPLPPTGWRLARATRTEPGSPARVLQTLEDGPFYARSLVRSQLLGQPVTAVHESLSMRRWARTVVQLMLPFRMPRRA